MTSALTGRTRSASAPDDRTQLALLLAGDDVDGDVPRRRLALERVEDLDAVDPVEVGVEHDGVGPQVAGERQPAVAPVADEHLEAPLVAEVGRRRS